MNLKPYPEYKDSGVAWLGKVPRHWEEKKAKYLFYEIDEKSVAGSEELLSVSHITGVTPRSQKNVTMFKAESYIGSKLCKSGDLVINTMWAWMAALGVSKQSGIVSNAYHVYRLRNDNTFVLDYIDKLLRTWSYKAQYHINSTGVRASRLRLYPDKFLPIPICIPPKKEQECITNFLKHKTSQIARFIKAKKRMIELLKEQKQVIINDAVTGKIDVTTGKPYPKYKDSGVEWLGKVPEGWEVRKIKYIKSNTPNSFVDGPFGSSLKSIHYVRNGDVYIVESGFITRGQFIWKEFKTITNEHFATIKRSECKGGDIIIAKIGAYYGMSGILPELDKKAVVSGNSLKLTINHSICNVEYIHYALLVAKNKSAFKFIVGETAQPALSLGGINRICLPLPNMNEQLEIIKVIKNKSRILDLTISRTEREIALMHEYRTRLISDVVTGKIDVRDIEIPDIADIDATIDESIDEPECAEELETAEAEE